MRHRACEPCERSRWRRPALARVDLKGFSDRFNPALPIHLLVPELWCLATIGVVQYIVGTTYEIPPCSFPYTAFNQGALTRMTRQGAVLFGVLCASALCVSSLALVIDDQPLNGVSEPSAWATLITPDPSYKPLMCVAAFYQTLPLACIKIAVAL